MKDYSDLGTPDYSDLGTPAVDAAPPVPMTTADRLAQYGVPRSLTAFGAGVGNSLADLGAGVVQNAYDRPMDYLFGGNRTALDTAKMNAINQEYQQNYGGSFPAMAGKFAGTVAPYVLGGEVAGLAKAPAFIGENASALARLGGVIGKNALFGAGTNALSFDPTGQESYASKLGWGGLFGGAGGAIGAGINRALMPSNWTGIQQALDAASMNRNADIAGNTPTQLGEVVGSPGLKRLYENFLGKIPFSGVNSQMQNVAQTIKQRGQSLLNSLLNGNSNEDVNSTLQQGLSNTLKNLQAEKAANWKAVNAAADAQGVYIPKNNFSQTAQTYLNEINSDPHLAGEMDSSIKNDLQKYATYGGPKWSDILNNESEIPNEDFLNRPVPNDLAKNMVDDESTSGTLKNSGIFRGKIGDKANEQYLQNGGNSYGYQIYRNLKDAMQKDIENGIGASNNQSLVDQYNAANKYHAENIAPFEDPELLKYTRQGADTDTLLNTFIKTSRNSDRANLIDKLVTKLPNEQQTLPAYGYLSQAQDANGNLNPLDMANRWNRLGPRQQTALIPDEGLRAQMNDFAALARMNVKPLTIMANPETGQKASDLLPLFLPHLVGGGIGGAAGYSHDGPTGGLFGSVLGFAAPTLLARPFTKALTSPTVRQMIVRNLISGNKTLPGQNYIQGGIAGVPAMSSPPINLTTGQ